MKEINEQLKGISELITRIDAKILDINNKLDAVIAAIHEYDDDQLEWPEPNDALLKAAGLYNEAEANKRMDIIGQNGNEGSHYNENEFDDYGKRIVWVDENKSNNPAKHTGGDKKRNKRKYYKPKQ